MELASFVSGSLLDMYLSEVLLLSKFCYSSLRLLYLKDFLKKIYKYTNHRISHDVATSLTRLAL